MAENEKSFLDIPGLTHLWNGVKAKFARKDLSNFSTYGPKVFVPEQTIEMRSTKVAIPGMDRIGLVEGETYTVKFNGTTYTCVAKWAYGALVLGNPGLVGYKSDTDEPFIIEDVPASMVSFVGGPANIAYIAQKYEYTVTARTDGGGTITAPGIAEHAAVGSKVYINDEWFEVDEIIDNDTISFVYYTFAAVGDIVTVYHETVTVSVEGAGETVQKINPKYIPAPDWTQNDKYSPGYIENRTHWQEEACLPLCDYKIGSNGYFGCYTHMHVGETYKVNWFGTIYECVAEEGESTLIAMTTDLFTITVSLFGFMKITPADTTLEYITVGITGPGKVHELDEKYLPTVTVDKGGTGRGPIPENNFLVGGPDGSYYMNKKTPDEVRELIEAAPAGYGWGEGRPAIQFTANNVNRTAVFVSVGEDMPTNDSAWLCEFYATSSDGSGNYGHMVATCQGGIAKGCICYRLRENGVCGEWEWGNPPMVLGVEYRTTERWNGKPVYAKRIYFGYLPNNTTANVPHGISGKTWNVKYSIDTNWTNRFLDNSITAWADITNISIATNSDMSTIAVYFTLWYTKD